jgi:hypothetical protein
MKHVRNNAPARKKALKAAGGKHISKKIPDIHMSSKATRNPSKSRRHGPAGGDGLIDRTMPRRPGISSSL